MNFGWLIRNLHAVGASMFFLAAYVHIFRGLYYGSYKAPREVLWIIGVFIFVADDGDGVHGLLAALGPDELLGRHRHHQPLLSLDSICKGLGTADRRVAVGRLLGLGDDAQPLLHACTICCPS